MEKFTNEQATLLFNSKFVISNSDGTIWTADKAEIYSQHQQEFETIAKDWQVLKCKKLTGTRGYGLKKVKFDNLEKTEYTRDQFSNTFSKSDCISAVCDLIARNIEKIKVPQKQD